MRYDPSESRRDLRLDFLRGLCLLKMVFNHLWQTPLHVVHKWLGYVTAAEGFFFISGVVVGIVHGRAALTHGLKTTSQKVLSRALQLYLANLALVLLFASMESAGWLHGLRFLPLWRDGFRWSLLLPFDQPYFLHVLPRYVAFLALTPLALWCLIRGKTLWLLLASLAPWAASLLFDGQLYVPFLERAASFFPLLSWQLLFFVGLILGFHRRRLADWWRQRRSRRWLLFWLGAVVFFILLRWGLELKLVELPRFWVRLFFGREHLGPIRLLNLGVMFFLLFELTDRFWRPLQDSIGRLLLPFGQNSLYVFLMHIPIVWWSKEAVQRFDLRPMESTWWFVVVDFTLIALLWWMTRRRIFFQWVPR